MTDHGRSAMEDGMKMLAIDIKNKTAEIASLRKLIREQCAAQEACGCYRRVILRETP